jgi:hypothetical protein
MGKTRWNIERAGVVGREFFRVPFSISQGVRPKVNGNVKNRPLEDSNQFPLGFYGEFDPGSGRTLAACLTHEP